MDQGTHSCSIKFSLNREPPLKKALAVMVECDLPEDFHLPWCNELSASNAVSAPEAGTTAWVGFLFSLGVDGLISFAPLLLGWTECKLIRI